MSVGRLAQSMPESVSDSEPLLTLFIAWTIVHTFHIIMSGFHAYDENGPLHPLEPDEVVDLVRRSKLVPPTIEDLSDRSKGDVISKGIAILQTIWFVMQCIIMLPLTEWKFDYMHSVLKGRPVLISAPTTNLCSLGFLAI